MSEFISNNLSFLALTETWQQGEQDTIYRGLLSNSISGHFVPRKYQIGGGVGIIFRKSLSSLIIEFPRFTTFEEFTIALFNNNLRVTISVIYRPPSSSCSLFLEEFSEFLESSFYLKNHLVIGDFNIHFDSSELSTVRKFKELITSFGFIQQANSSTHIHGHIIDFILTRPLDNIVPTVTITDIGISDHFLLLGEIEINNTNKCFKSVSSRNWKQFNLDSFNSDLIHSPLLQTNISALSLTESVNLYNSTLTQLIDVHAPTVTKRVSTRPNTEWFTKDILEAIRTRRKLERIWRTSKREADRKSFINQRNYVKSLVHQTKSTFYRNFISENKTNSKNLWSTVKLLLNRKQPSILPSYNTAYECANNFVSFFSEKISRIQDNFLPSCSTAEKPHGDFPSLSVFEPVTSSEIESILSTIKPKTSRLDPLPSWIIVSSKLIIAPIMSHICNISLNSGHLPPSEKKAIITPLLKKRNLNKEELSNYRPISGLSFLSKIIERVVFSRINTFLVEHDLYNPFQSAYRNAFSTETALVRMFNDLSISSANGDISLILFLDLSAAFDTVDHQLLLERLKYRFNMSGVVLKWFNSYITERSQAVHIDGFNSSFVPLLCGVPQGSVLGPVLYSLYTTPICDIISQSLGLNYSIYADDTSIFVSFNTTSFDIKLSEISDCFLCLQDWFNYNRLKLNGSKTEAMLIGYPNKINALSIEDIKIGDVTIKLSDSAKHLGIILDSHLNFDKQISSKCNASFVFLRQAYTIREFIDEDTAKIIISSYVTSQLDYCNSIYLDMKSSNQKKLQRILNCSARFVKRLPRKSSTSPVLRDLHWLRYPNRVWYKICCLIHKCIHGTAPPYLKELLMLTSTYNERSLRSSSSFRLHQPIGRRRLARSAFSVGGPTIWNSLSVRCRSESSNTKFRKLLKTELFNR